MREPWPGPRAWRRDVCPVTASRVSAGAPAIGTVPGAPPADKSLPEGPLLLSQSPSQDLLLSGPTWQLNTRVPVSNWQPVVKNGHQPPKRIHHRQCRVVMDGRWA